MAKLNIKVLMLGIIIIVLILIGLLFFSSNKVTLPKQVQINTKNQPTLGNPKAKVHVVVFEDLKCYSCMRYNVEVFPSLKKNYIDTGKAKYTVINLAFIPGSMPAANAARCLYKQNKKFFFPFVDAIYHHQPPENQDWATLPHLMKLASTIPGVDKQKLSQCIYQSPYVDFMNQNLKLGKDTMKGVVSTPTLYVNGYLVKPLTLDQLNKIMEANL